jgi:putative peptide zinc metalloprotease protein
MAQPGTRVRPGEVLIVCRDPALSEQVQELDARRRELLARYAEQHVKDLVKSEIIKEELAHVQESLARARERASELTIRSRTTGIFVAPQAADLPGRFVKQGELLGHVVELGTITVRTVVSQPVIDLVRKQTRAVEVRLAERLAETFPAAITRAVPGASERLPSPALGSQGGGQFATDPQDKQGVKSIQKVFQVDLELSAPSRVINVGGRVYVRFDHGWAPLGLQWYRQVRQLFLARFNV